MSIYLYIKQHSVTGKLYFGKTTKDPEKYNGSGLHWTRHVKKHGKKHVVTLWYELFNDKFELAAFAISFSNKMDIVKSEHWLNLKVENGFDGGSERGRTNKKHSLETINKLKILFSGENNGFYNEHHTDKAKQKIGIAQKGKRKSEEHKLKISLGQLGTKRGPTSEENKAKLRGKRGPQERVKCPHCGNISGLSAAHRHHFEKCKSLLRI